MPYFSFLNKITSIGTSGAKDLSETKKIKLLNQIALVFTSALGIKILFEIIAMDFFGLTIALVLLILYGFSVVLNFFNKYYLARFYFCFICITTFSLLNMAFGKGLGAEFTYFPFTIMIVIFFNKMKAQILWMLFMLSCYVSSIYFISNHTPPLQHTLTPPSFYINFLACCFAVFLMALVFTRENNLFEEQSKVLTSTLEDKNTHLAAANKDLERFAFATSHDLKTPLRNINNFLNLIQLKVSRKEYEGINEYLDYATLYTKRMHNLIQDMLEYSKNDGNKDAYQNFDLNIIMDEVLDNLKDRIDSKNVDVSVLKLPVIYCNRVQMISLFQNLIENGIKYNNSENIKIEIDSTESNLAYSINVKDNGIGIEKDFQDKIFEMFTRLHNQDEYEGTGIGLASVVKIASYHGGTISVDSTIQEGATFTFTIPKHSGDLTIQ